jgi:hypothetical protein
MSTRPSPIANTWLRGRRGLAGRLADLGAPVFACTPDQFPSMMAAAREDIKIIRQDPAC